MSRLTCTITTILLIALFVFSSCTYYYDPIAYPIRPGEVPEFTGNNEIMLENVQQSKKEIIGSIGFNKWMGDLYNWTDAAIKLLKPELEKRNIVISDKSKRVLKLAIYRANIYQGFWVIL